jgi:hypothetical protein
MTHAQKRNFVFRRNGRVHGTRRGRHFSPLLAAEVCGSAGSVCTVLERLRSAVVLGCWVPTPFSCCPFTSPPARRLVSCHLNRALPVVPSSWGGGGYSGEREADLSHPYSAEFKNAWSCNSTPPYAFMVYRWTTLLVHHYQTGLCDGDTACSVRQELNAYWAVAIRGGWCSENFLHIFMSNLGWNTGPAALILLLFIIHACGQIHLERYPRHLLSTH